jgi:hypothetical protein
MRPDPRMHDPGPLICSHLNPIDPAEYPQERVHPEDEPLHPRTGRGVRPLPPTAPKLASESSAARRDRIVPIVPQDWKVCFEEFSRSHEGWLATLTAIDAETGLQVEARDLPLAGVVEEPRNKAISIRLGPLTHFVASPSGVWLRIGPDGGEKALEIGAQNGARTVLEFRSGLPTEMVDGIAPFPAGDPWVPIRSTR